MREILCVANWKLHKNPRETREFLGEFLKRVHPREQKSFCILPPAINLWVMSECLKGTAVGWGAQNIYFKQEGAFTGENSAKAVQSMGATSCLVGHSERRILFSETNQELAKKVKLVQSLHMTPILCVGETLSERQERKTYTVIKDQLKVSTIDVDWSKPFVVAYEPVWAIGTGQVAEPKQAEKVHGFLRSQLKDLAGIMVAEKIKILYGGSVKPENAKALFSQENVDGFLVGGASLNPESFFDIYKRAIEV